MQNVENKIIAGAMVVFCALMAVMVFLTNRILDKACNCREIIPIGITEINKLLYENSQEMDSVSVHSDTTAAGSFRELQQRYGSRHHPEQISGAGKDAAQDKPGPESM
ncbi:hypothetical protein [Dyadobacter sediminis]|uniref:Uncharacterized protein n=1 Tax=Dyadobacter sediminis TaxID=1493691 RepID=A0A5R9KAX1_9BACT|nr:hypothetical protein [Dyadobacter sediminis]TLU91983.1 hypothetical protein FEM55_14575 [Dyadobacter sediminis]GGB98507.1 hypothetical protein GCM10011325_27220 [Dyadobacter sediminis]